MAIYADVEGVGRLEFPDGTDPAVIRATVQKVVGRGAPEAKPEGKGIGSTWLGGVARGIRDPIDAGAQLLTRGLEAIAPAGSSFETFMRGEREKVEGINKEAERVYKEDWGRGEGFDLPRLGGNIAATVALPVGAVGTAATGMGRAFQAARAGGILGLTQPVNDADSPSSFWGQKAGQGAVGAFTGGVANPVLEAGGRIATKAGGALVEKGRALGQRFNGGVGNDAAVRALREAGISLDDLSKQAQAKLIADAKQALSRYGGLDPDALARRADFAALGVDDPLKAWITRDPVAFTRTENLSGIEGVGNALAYTKSRLNETLKDRVAGLRPTGAPNGFEAGVAASKGIQGVEDAQRGGVDALYNAFREIAPDVPGNGARFVDRVSRALDDQMLGGELPAGVVARMQKIASGEFPLTPSTLYQMQKAASAQSKGNPSLGLFKKAIDDELIEMAAEHGPRMGLAAGTLQAARGAARERFASHEAVPALKAAAEGKIAPETFFRDFVQGGTVKEVANMWSKLGKDGAAKDAIRSQFADMIQRGAIGSASFREGVVSQHGINKLLDQPGMKQKLQIIMGPRAVRDLERVARVAEASTKQPAGAKVNNSNTTAALASLLNKTSGFPVIGPMMSQPLMRMADQIEAAALARSGPASLGMRVDPWADPRVQESTRRIAGLLGPSLGLYAAGQNSR